MTANDTTIVSKQETDSKKSEIIDQRGKVISLGVRSLTAQNLGTSVLAFVFVTALIRFLPSVQYGIYSAVSVTVSIATAFATFGLQYALARFVPILRDKGNLEAAAKRIIFLSIFVSTTVTLVFVALTPYISLFFTKSTSSAPIFVLGALWLFSSSVALIFQSIVQGLKKYELLGKLLFVTRAIMVIFTIIGLIAYANVSVAILAWLLYGVLIVGWAVKAVRRDLNNARKTNVQFDPNGLRYSQILRYSFPLGVAGVLSIMTTNSDLLVLGGYLDPVSLGIYNAAVTISSFLTFVLLTPLVTAILPEASSSADNSAEVSAGLRLAIRFVFLAVLPTSLFVAAASPQLLFLFSGQESYLAGSGSLQLIAAFYLFLGIQTVIYPVLLALGRTTHALLITASATATEIGMSVILVPHIGLIGAAASRALSAGIGMIVSLYLARRFLKLDSFGFYSKGIISAIIPFFVILCLSGFISHSVLTLLPYGAIAATLFFFCIRKLKVLSDEDRVLIGHILPRQVNRILRYL